MHQSPDAVDHPGVQALWRAQFGTYVSLQKCVHLGASRLIVSLKSALVLIIQYIMQPSIARAIWNPASSYISGLWSTICWGLRSHHSRQPGSSSFNSCFVTLKDAWISRCYVWNKGKWRVIPPDSPGLLSSNDWDLLFLPSNPTLEYGIWQWLQSTA